MRGCRAWRARLRAPVRGGVSIGRVMAGSTVCGLVCTLSLTSGCPECPCEQSTVHADYSCHQTTTAINGTDSHPGHERITVMKVVVILLERCQASDARRVPTGTGRVQGMFPSTGRLVKRWSSIIDRLA